MAADAVDAGAEDLLRLVAPSCTDRVPLLGADGFFAMQNQIGIWVRAVVPKPTSSSFNVLLNANATANLTVGWFIVN